MKSEPSKAHRSEPACSNLSWLSHKATADASSADEVPSWKAEEIQAAGRQSWLFLILHSWFSWPRWLLTQVRETQTHRFSVISPSAPHSLKVSPFAGNPQQTQDQWVIADDRLQYDFKYPDGQEEEGNMGPVSSAEEVGSAEEVQILQTTPKTHVLDVEGGLLMAVHARFLKDCLLRPLFFFENHSFLEPNKPKDSSLWKITLVVAVLLVSAAGLLSIAYYMCVWRGGRIHYNLHKGGYA